MAKKYQESIGKANQNILYRYKPEIIPNRSIFIRSSSIQSAKSVYNIITMAVQKILEITGERPKLELPIVNFPPFKLRAWLIEKDPVVWAHLLETYVQYFKFLNHGNNIEDLNESTHDHLCIFLRTYLKEMAEEEGKLLSLGANSDVTKQLQLLRTWVFELIKKCGLMHFQLHGETIWNLVKYYANRNPNSVRALLDGSLKPQINTTRTQLNWAKQIQTHLKMLLETGKFDRIDLKCFESLLGEGDHTKSNFNSSFLTTNWVETLEQLWNKGQGRSSEIVRQLMLICLITSPDKVISKLLKDLEISNIENLVMYPLLGSIILNKAYEKYNKSLKKDFPFLNVNMSIPTSQYEDIEENYQIDQNNIDSIKEIFPDLTDYQVELLLVKFENNVETLTDALFEDPTIVESIPKEKPKSINTIKKPLSGPRYRRERRKSHEESEIISDRHVPDELRNKTLTRALELLYEKDEDEHDDTYDESEVNHANLAEKISLEDEVDKTKSTNETNTNKIQSQFEANEKYLWELLKKDKEIFSRSRRGTKERKNIKKETNWSDEQIEGWARMLERSPQRARILEEKYMFRGNVKRGKTSYVKNRDENSDNEAHTRPPKSNNNRDRKNPQSTKEDNQQTQQKSKKQFARNEKNKASRANHNRKAGNMKKQAKAGL